MAACIQGGAINCGLKLVFSMYRLSCLIEAYGSPGNHWFVCAGLLATHLFNLSIILISDSMPTAAERMAGVVDVFPS